MPKLRIIALCIAVAGASSLSCSPSKTPLVIFAAASLGGVLDSLAAVYENEHPEVDVRIELSASRVACGKLLDQGRQADLLMVADAPLLDAVIAARAAAFSIAFAGNAVVLAYHPQSALARDLEGGMPWQQALLPAERRIGIANPEIAPVGYRALLALRLNDLIAPEALRHGAAIAAKIGRRHQRPDAVKLLAPLQSGEFDAAFLYRSTAKQHALRFVELDERINFSDEHWAEFYAKAKLAQGPNSAAAVGAPATYALTIPANAEAARHAAKFVTLLLADRGRRAAAAGGIEMFDPGRIRVHGISPSDVRLP